MATTTLAASTSSVLRVLRRLDRQGSLPPMNRAVIASAQPWSVVRWLRQRNERRDGKHKRRKVQIPSFVSEALMDVAPPPKTNSFEAVMLTHPTRSFESPAAMDRSCVHELPIDVKELMRFIDATHISPFIRGAQDCLQIASGGGRPVEEAIPLLCGCSSTDLLVVEMEEDPMHHVDDASRQQQQTTVDVFNALNAAAYLLKPSGSLLFVSHASLMPQRRLLQRRRSWAYQHVHVGCTPEKDAHYLFCSSSTTELPLSEAAQGRVAEAHFTARGAQRSSRAQWRQDFDRQNEPFVATLRPRFTQSHVMGDALVSRLEAEAKAEEEVRKREESFFGVAHEMVEKGLHYQQPDN